MKSTFTLQLRQRHKNCMFSYNVNIDKKHGNQCNLVFDAI